MIESIERSLLLIVSAPSGAGKSTLCDRLVAKNKNMRYSVSCTTRAPRDGEVDGKDYFFVDEPEFRARIEAGAFLEYAQVHGAWYGTLRSTIESALSNGMDIILDIDVQGASKIRASIASLPPDHLLHRGYADIFIAPPSMDELRSRLEGRAKDSGEVIERRMRQAKHELQECGHYKYFVVNDDLDDCEKVLDSIVCAEHHVVLEEI